MLKSQSAMASFFASGHWPMYLQLHASEAPKLRMTCLVCAQSICTAAAPAAELIAG
jgi:hypothetical protein